MHVWRWNAGRLPLASPLAPRTQPRPFLDDERLSHTQMHARVHITLTTLDVPRANRTAPRIAHRAVHLVGRRTLRCRPQTPSGPDCSLVSKRFCRRGHPPGAGQTPSAASCAARTAPATATAGPTPRSTSAPACSFARRWSRTCRTRPSALSSAVRWSHCCARASALAFARQPRPHMPICPYAHNMPCRRPVVILIMLWTCVPPLHYTRAGWRRHPEHRVADHGAVPNTDTGADRRGRPAHPAAVYRGADRGADLPHRHLRRGLRADRALHRVHDGEL